MDKPKAPQESPSSPLWGARQIILETPERPARPPLPPEQPWVGKGKVRARRRRK